MSNASSVGPDEARALLDRYLGTREPGDLFAAFGSAKTALAATPPESHAYVERVRTLADVMFAYFDLTGGFSVIDCAIEMRRREALLTEAVDSGAMWALQHPSWRGGTFSRAVTDDDWTLHHPDGRRSQIRKDWSSWCGEGWPMGWQVRRPDGVMVELEEEQWGDSWQLDPTGPPPPAAEPSEVPPVEALVARTEELRSAFLQTGDTGALEEALWLARSAVERTQGDDSLRAIALNTAAMTAHDWFRATGHVEVLREAARYARLAVDDADAFDVSRGTHLNTLAAIHQALYVATGEPRDLAHAIDLGRRATAAAGPPGDWSISATNLVAALADWYDVTHDREALEEATELARTVIEETPAGHPRRPGRLNTYGNVLMSWFEETNDLAALDRVISIRREALGAADPDEVDYPSILNNLGNALHTRARAVADAGALREAVQLRREAVARTPPHSLHRVAHLRNLATALDEWRGASGEFSDDAELENVLREIDALERA